MTVIKPVLTKQEKSLKLLADTIESADEEQKYEEKLILPAKLEGREIRYSEKHSCDRIYIPSAGSCGCGTYGIQGKFSGKRREKEEEYGAGIGLFRYSIWFVRLSGSRFSSQESLGTAC